MPSRPVPLAALVVVLLLTGGAAAAPQTPPARAGGTLAGAPTAVLVVPPEEPPRWRGERIDLSLRDADLVEVLRSFARLGDFDLVVDPRVKGSVTVELKDVPWDLALAVILRTHGLAAEIDGRIVGVRPLPGPGLNRR
jgi:type II secretory pathway component HofQ